jgi:plasmid stabilization system protein ParE
VRVVFRPKFLDDLSDSYAWIAPESLTSAERLFLRVDATIGRLQRHPMIDASREALAPGLRSIRARPFPHLIFYRLREDEVVLIRLLHGGRLLESQEYDP